ncbi:MAG: hypothetical protein HDR31_00900 [Mycoplasma sp.]|nr:hypothetical protein [Mycoplasma sp.]
MLINSYPKINLCLLIGKKKKGKHKIKSIFLKVQSIWDTLQIEENDYQKDEINYFDKTNKKINIENCILIKTLNVLRDNKILKNVFFKIIVTKNIPLRAGLGGGSSNSGNLIKFLIDNKYLKKKISKKLISFIGSDVMFFVKDFKVAKVYGYGEKVKEIKVNNLPNIEIIDTKIKCSTKEIFKIYDKNENKIKNNFNNQLKYFKDRKYNFLINELESSIYKYSPELQKKVSELQKTYKVFVSGSGGTCFRIKE